MLVTYFQIRFCKVLINLSIRDLPSFSALVISLSYSPKNGTTQAHLL